MVLGGPSAFLRGLFPEEEPCECNTLTIILPDFDENTIKNLLGLLYTGKQQINNRLLTFVFLSSFKLQGPLLEIVQKKTSMNY